MSGPRRKKIYDFLVARDGEFCWIGGETGNNHTLVIDHWDNNNANNDLQNLHLICRSVNALKNPRGRSRKIQSSTYVCADVSASITKLMNPRSLSPELEKNLHAEPRFRHWLFSNVVHHTRIKLATVLNGGAETAHCSQETIKRYVRKLTWEEGLYHMVMDIDTQTEFVELKPAWDTFRKKIEEVKKLDEQVKNWKEAKAEPC
jgi:hypothetical protein